MSQLLKNILSNLTSMLLALFLALIIWAAAVRSSNPTETKDFQLSVSVIERPDAIVLNEIEERVQIRVEAPRNTLEAITVSDFDAFVDLNGVSFGRTDAQIEIAFDPSIQLIRDNIQIFPATTAVNLDELVTVDLPVRVNIQGNPADTHSIGTVSTNPETISVSGPAGSVNELKEARATVFLDNTRETRLVTRPLIYYDLQDNPVSLNSAETTVSDSQTAVTVEIEERAGVASISIRPRWRGRTATGYRFLSAVPNPRNVLVQGSPDIIQALRSISTEEIDISGLKMPEIFSVSLDLPEGVTLLDSNPVVVEVDIEQILTSDQFEVTPTVIGLEETLSATVAISTVNVVLFGPLELLDSISASDIRADLSLFGLEAGEHLIEPVISPPPLEGIEIRSFQPEVVAIVIGTAVTETITGTETVTDTLEGGEEGAFYTVPPAQRQAVSQFSADFANRPRFYYIS